MAKGRLSGLSPRWVVPSGWSSESRFYVGVSFICPHCEGVNRKRLVVLFWPPIDPEGLQGRDFTLPHNGGHNRVFGEDFDSLTIEPSIGFDNIGHWHGRITNGFIL